MCSGWNVYISSINYPQGENPNENTKQVGEPNHHRGESAFTFGLFIQPIKERLKFLLMTVDKTTDAWIGIRIRRSMCLYFYIVAEE